MYIYLWDVCLCFGIVGLWLCAIDGGEEDPTNAENSGNTTQWASRCLTLELSIKQETLIKVMSF